MFSYELKYVTQAPWRLNNGMAMGRGDGAPRTNQEDSYAMVQCEGDRQAPWRGQ